MTIISDFATAGKNSFALVRLVAAMAVVVSHSYIIAGGMAVLQPFEALTGYPLGAHAAWQGPRDFAGVERGWPKAFPDNVCARLELVRGTLNSSAATEHFPYNPGGAFRHPEGWTAFNAAFNVALAVACREMTRLIVRPERDGWQVELTAPFTPAGAARASDATVLVTTGRGETRTLSLRPVPGHDTIRRGMILRVGGANPKGDGTDLRLAPGETVSFSYGYGLSAHSVTVTAPKRVATAQKD